MKPFDLNLAKQGHPVCTRDGRKARILCFDRKGGREIVALVDTPSYGQEEFFFYGLDGMLSHRAEGLDLMMASVKKEGWVNVYKRSFGYITSTVMSDTEIEAKRDKDNDCIDTVKVEWEE